MNLVSNKWFKKLSKYIPNKKNLPKVVVVCGPTATGKSDKAVEIALERNGEIISADSRQVYKGLDLGSGKITKEEMKGVLHHLLDVADPRDVFSADDFITLGTKAISEILNKGKLPIICGGTGFYIDGLIHESVLPNVPADESLRKELEPKSLTELQEKLKELDEDRYGSVDAQNKVRLIRSIEIATALGKVPQIKKELKYEIEYVYLDFPKDILRKRIEDRLLKRLEDGMIKEVQNLHSNGLSFERMKQLGLEYKYIAMYLLNELSYEEMVAELTTKTYQYAKRQRTWFKKHIPVA